MQIGGRKRVSMWRRHFHWGPFREEAGPKWRKRSRGGYQALFLLFVSMCA
jgi:hypothetical protein